MDFSQALNIKMKEIERPPLPPVGHYVWKVSKVASIDESPDGAWEFLAFPVVAVEPREDVDPKALAKVGGVKAVRNNIKFVFNKGSSDEDKAAFDRTLYNLKRFLSDHLKVEGDTLKEAVDAAVGALCIGNIQYRADKNDPEVMYAEIGRTAPLD